jgi:hypothetical protein
MHDRVLPGQALAWGSAFSIAGLTVGLPSLSKTSLGLAEIPAARRKARRM